MIYSSNQDIEVFLLILVIGVSGLYALLNWVTITIQKEKQEKLWYWLIVSSPVWLSLSLVTAINGISLASSEGISTIMNPVSILSLIIVLFTFTVIASHPAALAHSIIRAWQLTTPPVNLTKGSALITLQRRVNRWYTITAFILLTTISTTLLSNIYLLHIVHLRYEEFGNQLFWLIWFLTGILLIYTIFEERVRYSQNIFLSETFHPENSQIQKILETVAITAGIQIPNLHIIPSPNANAFTIKTNGQQPTIYLTSSLIDISSDEEIQTVIAHEVAHITSGKIQNYQIIHLMLSLLRICGFFTFLILLATFNPILPFLWGIAVIRAYLGQKEDMSGEYSGIHFIAAFTNPIYVLIQLLSYVVYYALSFQEDFLADIKAMDYTRYPKPFYSLLQKLQLHRNNNEFLPSEFHQLYFNGENACISTIPSPIPSLEERWELIKQLDPAAASVTKLL